MDNGQEFLKVLMDTEIVKTRQEKDDMLVEKWGKFGLFKGIGSEGQRRTLARLYENQKNQIARQMVMEQTSMAGSDIQGFAPVALPLVRRIFGNLVASQDLVSVQSMEAPVGLIFVLDFLAGTNKGGVGLTSGTSIYGGGRIGAQILSGINLDGINAESGFQSLNSGYSTPTGSVTFSFAGASSIGSGTVAGTNDTLNALVRFDPDLSGSFVTVLTASKSTFVLLNESHYMSITDQSTTSGTLIKRLTRDYPLDTTKILLVYSGATVGALNEMTNTAASRTFKYGVINKFTPASDVLGAVTATNPWGYEFDGNAGQNAEIPEIDMQVTSFDIRSHDKMLSAKWTAQLSQDLASWQNMDAEVELSSVLAEQVAMEIDMEILKDLVEGAKATVRYWSRRPGRFVNPETGVLFGTADQGDFTGIPAEWYRTLIERINDISAVIARKTLRGGATFLVCSPEAQSILESTNEWFAATTVGESDKKGSAGLAKAGGITNKWDVYVSPYFLRQLILVGRKGSRDIETGYVYAPYIPMITSPTIPSPDNLFVYKKGVMTRYGKKMIRPDYYAVLIIQNLVG